MGGLIPIDYAHDGVSLRGRLAMPRADGRRADGPRPAVLVMPDAMGLGAQACDRAEALAALGYAALAGDMYGDGRVHHDRAASAADFVPLMADGNLLRARAAAALETLVAQPDVDPGRTGAIGFCFGGLCVLELARDGADLKAVSSFHGLLQTSRPAAPGAIAGEIAVFTGARDPYAPSAHVDALRDEMDAAGAHLHLTVFAEGYHAFTNPDEAHAGDAPGLRYDPLLDAMSWAATLALLDKTLH